MLEKYMSKPDIEKEKIQNLPTCKWFDFYFDFISNHVTYLEGNH